MPNQMDSRNRSAFDIVADLKKVKGFKLAVLGSHNVDAKTLASALPEAIQQVLNNDWKDPLLVMTGCAPVGVEKAVRLAAKEMTGRSAVVFHRAETVYGPKKAEQMRDVLLAQEADALLIISSGKKTCKHARDRFSSRMKRSRSSDRSVLPIR